MSTTCNNNESNHQSKLLSGKNILMGASGSVASIRIPRLLSQLHDHGANVRLITTKCSQHFISNEEKIPHNVTIYTDEDEWKTWNELSDPVLHIELRKWADVFIIAPASANTIAKLANGLCDNLLTCVARAWPLLVKEKKPFLIAPAMNTFMWQHPITDIHIRNIEQFGIHIISPISKRLACGDIGIGGMEQVSNIVNQICKIV